MLPNNKSDTPEWTSEQNANIENYLTKIKETVSRSNTRNEALNTKTSNRFDELKYRNENTYVKKRNLLYSNLSDIKENWQESKAIAPGHQFKINHAYYAGAVGHLKTSNNHTAEKQQDLKKSC